MHDSRLERLAEILVDHSCEIADGEKVLIEAFDLPSPDIVCRLVELVSLRGGIPLETKWTYTRSIGGIRCIVRSEFQKQNGLFCDIQRLPWRRRPR